jgi:hypothetical protein
MKTKHSEQRAQQRGISDGVERLLQVYGEVRPATHGCVVRFFSKKAIKEIEAELGHFFIAKNHESLRSYLIESCVDHAIVTVGKLYQKQRLTKSKVNRLYH